MVLGVFAVSSAVVVRGLAAAVVHVVIAAFGILGAIVAWTMAPLRRRRRPPGEAIDRQEDPPPAP